MNKKKAIVETLLGKIQARSSKLYEDVNSEIWSFEEPKEEQDFEVKVDDEEIVKSSEESEPEDVYKALDVILDAGKEDELV